MAFRPERRRLALLQCLREMISDEEDDDDDEDVLVRLHVLFRQQTREYQQFLLRRTLTDANRDFAALSDADCKRQLRFTFTELHVIQRFFKLPDVIVTKERNKST